MYSGYGEEILRYWKQLDQSPNVMATQYYTVLRSIEEKQDGEYQCGGVGSTLLEFIGLLLPTENTGLSPEGVCSMFRTVGKVVNNLGFSDEVSTPVMYVFNIPACKRHAMMSFYITCNIFGKYIQYLLLMSILQALPLLQHYLQLCEAHFEPDGVEVAIAFTEIAEAYTHIGRYGYRIHITRPALQA